MAKVKTKSVVDAHARGRSEACILCGTKRTVMTTNDSGCGRCRFDPDVRYPIGARDYYANEGKFVGYVFHKHKDGMRMGVKRGTPLFPKGVKIPVIGLTGEYQSGKTIFIASIAPGAFEGDGKPRTRMYDFEMSGSTYDGTGWDRIDVPTRMLASEKSKDGTKRYAPIDVFKWWYEDLLTIKPGQYDVIGADPITDIEAGMVDYVMQNPAQFGCTQNQFLNAKGIFWGILKQFEKQILADLSARCQCFAFTAHLRDEWGGDRPTGKREPKGKDTLMELASLYLWLERKAGKDNNVPEKPSAIVIKSRLSGTAIDEKTGELKVVSMMPPRIPIATVAAIRQYILTPPNYEKLKPEEMAVEVGGLSEDQKLVLQAEISANNAAAEVTSLERLNRQAELKALAAKQQPPLKKATDATGEPADSPAQSAPATDGSSAMIAKKETKRKVSAARSEKSPPVAADGEKAAEPTTAPAKAPATAPAKAEKRDDRTSQETLTDGDFAKLAPEQLDRLIYLRDIGFTNKAFDTRHFIAAMRGPKVANRAVSSLGELTQSEASSLIALVEGVLSKAGVKFDAKK